MNHVLRSSSRFLVLLLIGAASVAVAQTPAPPWDLRAVAVSSTQINLSWMIDFSSGPYDEVRVERKTGPGGTWTEIANLPGGPQTTVNSSLDPGTDYFYRVRAMIAGNPSAYSAEVNVATRPASVQTQFASNVVSFSTEYSTGGFSAAQLLGPPDIYPRYGDNGSAWASLTPDDQREFLELSYASPMQASRVEIFEVLEVGSIDTVYVRESGTGTWHIVYAGPATPLPGIARVMTVKFPLTPFLVDAVRLAVNSPAVPGWNEIDAVSISDEPPVGPDPSNAGAMFFDGINDRVRITDGSIANGPVNPSAYAIPGTALTVEAWVYPMATPAAGRYFNIITRPSMTFYANPFRAYGLLINTSSSDGIARFGFSVSDGVTPIGGGGEVLVESPTAVPVGEWTHIAGTYDGTKVSLYLNGELVRSIPFSVPISQGSTGLYIGGISGDFFRGVIDDVRLWNVTRLAGEIRASYGSDLSGGEPGLAGYWPFNTTALPAAAWTPDLTANSNDLIVQNGAQFLAFPFPMAVTFPPTNITAMLNSVSDVPYASRFNSDGWPTPTFTLVSGPSGMTYDGDSLSWTPTETDGGNHQVIVDAVNSAGSVRDTITIWTEVVRPIENDTRFDLTNRGKIGAFGQYGKGIVVNGQNGLYTADIGVVDRNDNKFAGGLYTSVNSFAPAEGFTEVPSMAVGYSALRTSYTDAWESNRIGLRVLQTSYIKSGTPDHRYTVVDYQFVNESGAPLDDIFLQVTADFDVGMATNNLAGYDTTLGVVYAVEAGGATNPAAYGIQVLGFDGDPSGMAVWSGGDNPYVRSTANLTTFTPHVTTPTDVRGQISVGPYSAGIGDTMHLTVAYLGAPSLNELLTAAARAKQIVLDPVTVSDLPIDAEIEPNGTLALSNVMMLDTRVSGAIEHSKDVDYFTFTTATTDTLQFVGFKDEGSNLRYKFEIYDAGGGFIYNSAWYFYDEEPFGAIQVNPGTYTVRVSSMYYYDTYYPFKRPFAKGSKEEKLEAESRGRISRLRVAAAADTSGGYALLMQRFKPILPRFGYHGQDGASESKAWMYQAIAVAEPQTLVELEYGSTTAYGQTKTVGYFDPYWIQTPSPSLPGLQPGTQYHVRFRATGSLGSSYGPDIAVTTASPSRTWAVLELPDGNTSYLQGADVVNERLAYVAGSQVFRTTNAGLTWQDASPYYSHYHYSQAIKFVNDARGYSAGYGHDPVVVTNDSGKTWISVFNNGTHMNMRAIAADPTGQYVMAVGYNGLVIHSSDFGASFTVDTLPGPPYSVVSVSYASPGIAVAVDDNGFPYRTTDGGSTWSTQPSLYATMRAIQFVSPTTGYLFSTYNIHVTTDAGQSWTLRNSYLPYIENAVMTDELNGIIAGNNGTIYRTTDGWVTATSEVSGVTTGLLGVDSQNGFTLVVGTRGSMLVDGLQFEQEPNNVATSAAKISYNATVSGVLDPNSDYDYYSFEASAGDTVEISAFVPGVSDLYPIGGTVIQLYDPLGTRISFGDWFAFQPPVGVTDRLVRILPVSGIYSIRIGDPRYTSGIFPNRTVESDEVLVSPTKSSVTSPTSTYTVHLRRLPASAPLVVGAGFQGLFHDRVYIRSNILPNGGTTTGGVEYGTTPALGSFAAFEGTPITGVNAVTLRAPLTGLTASTRYYYRPTATNEFGTFATDSIYELVSAAPPNGWVYSPTGTEATLLDVSVSPYQGLGFAVGTGGNVRRTFNFGATWDSVNVAAPLLNTIFAVYAPDYYNTAVLAGSGNFIRKTTDGGDTWYTPTTPYPTSGPSWQAMHFLDRWSGVVGGTNVVMMTNNTGDVWNSLTPLPAGSSIRAVQLVDALTIVAGTSSGAVARSTDGGTSWMMSQPFVSKPIDVLMFYDSMTGFAGSQLDSMLYRTMDGGTSWIPFTLPGNGASGLRRGVIGNDGTGYVSTTTGGVFITTDGGNSWTLTATGSGSVLFGLSQPVQKLAFASGPFGAVFVRDTRPTDLTMYVAMRGAIASGLFNPATDSLILRGSRPPLSWSGVDHILTSTGWTDSVYQVQLTLPEPGLLEYKFVIRHRGNDLWERSAYGNRYVNLPRGPVGHYHWFDDRPLDFTLADGQYAPAANTMGLYHVDEDTTQSPIWGGTGYLAIDHAATSNHGTYGGSVMVDGRHGKARYFSGDSGNGIRLEQGIFTPDVTPYSFTIEFWTKLDQYPAMNAAAVYSGGKYDAFIGVSTNGRLRIGIRSVAMNVDSSSRTIELNRWVHLAMQYDAAAKTMRGYIDGQLVVDNFLGALFNPGSTPSQAFIGTGPVLGIYRGTIDEVRISRGLVDPSAFNLVIEPGYAQASSGDRRVDLSWLPAPGGLPVDVYRIYRGADSVSMSVIDSVNGVMGTYSDTTAVNGAVYYYRVTAVDITGFEGRPTPALLGTPLPLPSIVGTIPARNTVQAAATALVSLQFNTDIDTTSLDLSDVRVVGSLTGPMAIERLRYFPGPRLLEVVLDTNLLRGEEVEVTVGRPITNINGDSLFSPLVFRYRTAGSGGTGLMTGTNVFTGSGNPTMFAAADIDNDGDVDVVTANGGGNSLSVFKNGGNGDLTSFTTLTQLGTPLSIVLTDVNGDDLVDMAVSAMDQNNVVVWYNLGSGNFGSSVNYGVGAAPFGLAAGDLNGDGATDIVVTNSGSGTFTVMTNLGTGSFVRNTYGPTGATPTGVALADMNRDGSLDVILTAAGGATVEWFRNTGVGFVAQEAIALGGGGYAVAVADANGDGQNDIITGLSITTNNLRIDRLNAAGSVIGTSAFTVGTDIRGLAVGDFNGDGLADVAVTDNATHVVKVLANNGAGGFAEVSSTPVGNNPWHLVSGDFDRDGDLDLIAGSQNSGLISVLRNNVDNSAPIQVANPTISESSGRVTVQWSANPEPDISRTVIFRSPVPTPTPARFDSVAVGVTTYTDLTVVDSTTYVYTLKAVDLAGNESPLSFSRAATPHARQAGEYSSTDTSTVLLVPFAELSGSSYNIDATSMGQSGLAIGGHTSVAGKFGAAKSFNGAQYIRFPNRAYQAPTGPFTVEAWVRPSVGGAMTILRKDTSNSSGYALTLAAGGYPRFEAFQPAAAAQSPSALIFGVWSHVAGVFTGTEVQVYVNGTLAASTAASGPLTIGTAFLGIGAIPSASPSVYFVGDLDEIRMSTVARAPGEFNLQLTPRSVAASAAGTTINVSWQNGGGTAPLLRYRIYRGADSTSMSVIDSTTATSYSNSDLDPATDYFYRVTAVDVTGTESPRSFAASATTSAAPQQATVTTFAGSTQGTLDATGTSAQFSFPEAAAMDDLGNVYVADGGNGSLRKITPMRVVTTLATAMGTVTGVAVDSVGNVFVASSNQHKVYRITPAGVKTVYAGSGAVGMADGDSTDAEFNGPSGLAFDRSGNLYVADRDNNVIRRISKARFVELVAGSGSGIAGFTIGTGTAAKFDAPSSIALEPSGNLVVADRDNNAIRRLTVGGGGSISVTTISGQGVASPGSADGVIASATFNGPTGVTVDQSGNIFVADRANSTIRRISPAGIVSTIAGTASLTGNTDDLGALARFTQPSGLVADPTSSLYVADRDNHRLRRVLTNYVPSVFTSDATLVTASGATMAGYANPNGFTTNWYFEYGTSTSYESQTAPTSMGLGSSFLQRSSAISGLTANTTYHFRLVATNESGTSFGADRTFTTSLPAPGAPALTSPDSAATGVSVTPTLAWSAGVNAESYRLQLSLASNFASIAYEDSGITALSRTVPTLAHDIQYYWRVRSENVTGASSYTSARFFRTVVDTPDVPTLAAPSNSATDQPVALTLAWSPAARATSYRVQVSASNTFGVLSFEDSTLTDTSVVVSGLANLTTYYWRVSAKNAGGTSATSSIRQFTTIIAAPAEPTLAAPADSAANQPATLTLSWNAAARASTYHLQVGADASFATMIMQDSTITGTSRLVGTLSNATTYFWRVRAKNVGGTTAFTSTRRFTTIVSAPAAPVLATPDSNATNIPVTVLAAWSPADRAERYQVQLSATSGFTSLLVNDSTTTDTSRSFTGLSNNQLYYWRVRSFNSGGISAYSSVWPFRTIVSAPDVPTLAAPADSVVDQPVTLPFSWNAANRATSYRLEISTDSLFGTLAFVDSTTTSTTKAVGPLAFNTRFYWRVRGQNVGGSSAFSDRRTFRTMIELPPSPVLVGPDTLSNSVPTMAQLIWRSAPRAVSYRVQVSLFSNFGINVTDQVVNAPDSTLMVGPLFNDTTYYWRVSATNTGGTSAFSASWRFRTIIAAPDAPALASPLEGASDQPILTTFAWSSANRASSYRLDVSLQNDFATFYFVDSTITGTTRQVTLTNAQTYFWRVRGQNVGGNGSYSPTRSLTTIVQSPGIPVLVAPDSASVSLPVTLSLEWRRAARATSYQVQVSQISNFSTTVTNQTGWVDSALTVGPLLNDTEYFWRVNANNAGGTSAYSPVWRFRTVVAAPAVPTLVSPADNATNILTTVSVSWFAAARAATYRLQVSNDPGFGTGVQEFANVTGTTQSVTALSHDVVYYWRVQSENAGGVSGYSAPRQFRTVVAPPVSAPTLVGPADNAQNVLPSVSLSWNAVAGAANYHAQVSTSSVFATLVIEDSTLTTTSTTPGVLSYDTQYYWRVRSKNAGGTGPWSVTRVFRTAPSVPMAVVTPSRVDFGSVEAGFETADRTVTLSNNGGVSLNVTSVTLAGADPGSFAILSGQGAFALTPGATRQFNIRFQPTSRGPRQATLVIQSNDTRYPSGLIDTLSAFATDNTAPYNASTTPSIAPSTWTRTLPITVSWNPAVTDVSGVTNVWVAMGSAPTVNAPGTQMPLTNQSFLVPTPVSVGSTPLYFYFEDGAGNKDPNRSYQVLVRYDDLVPEIDHDTTAVPEVTVQAGVASGPVTISGLARDNHAGASGIKSFMLEYRRVGDANFIAQGMNGGSAQIPAGTFVLNGGPVGVDYRLVAIDSADNRTATRVHSVRVRTIDAPPPQPTPLPSVASLAPGTDVVRAYRLFSVPYDLSDKRPSQIFPLTTNLGPHEADGVPYANWRLQRFDNGIKSDYEAFKDLSVLTPGSAYFLIVKSSNKRISVGAGSVVNAQNMNDVGIPLQTGWNLVGNPLLRDIVIDSLKVTGSAVIQQRAGYTGSGAASGWDMNPTVLRQWEGLAIRVSGPTNLLFRTIGSQPGLADPDMPIGRMSASEAVAEEGGARSWFIPFGATRTDNDMTDLGDAIGMVAGAEEGVDRYDHFQPPFVGVRNVALYFDNQGDAMMQDIRPVSERGGVWEMKVVTGDEGAKVRLTTGGPVVLPDASFEAFLIDLDQKMAYDLSTTSELTINTMTGRRNFRVVVGKKDFVIEQSGGVDLYPKDFQLYTNYPNPFNPETMIRYTIADRSGRLSVSLRVYDVLGREVAMLIDREQAAGYYEVPFNGAGLSSGPYFYRLQVTDESGRAVFARVQKMALIK